MTKYAATAPTDSSNQEFGGVYDSGTGGIVAVAAGSVSADGNHNGQLSAPMLTQLADAAGTNKALIDAQGSLHVTDGGTATLGVTASSAAAVKVSAGRLCRIITTSTATAALAIYDNTNGASGTIIGYVPASTAVGTMFSPQTPAAVGIYVGGSAGTPAVTISFE